MKFFGKGSHDKIECKCDANVSPKCVKVRYGERRYFALCRERNNGQYVCLYCSRQLKFRGRNNPNAKYPLDDNLFQKIDSHAKAYLLGWIASDGTVRKAGFSISIHKKDKNILTTIQKSLNIRSPITFAKNKTQVKMAVNSAQIAIDVSRLLGLDINARSMKKDRIVKMPILENESLQWAFIRGYFDGDGSIINPSPSKRTPYICIASYSPFIREGIAKFCNIPCRISKENVCWSGSNALDFLDKMYGNETVLALERKLDLYYKWCLWAPSILKGKGTRGGQGNKLGFQWSKTLENAVPPFKTRASDSGYDLTLIDIYKTIGDVVFYRTGIKVKPPYGFYFDLVPRSSISKTGYILTNSIGIIDQSYVGEIIVPLRKIDKDAPEIELPARLCQIIPRRIIHFQFEQVVDLEDTSRQAGGFGSTGA